MAFKESEHPRDAEGKFTKDGKISKGTLTKTPKTDTITSLTTTKYPCFSKEDLSAMDDKIKEFHPDIEELIELIKKEKPGEIEGKILHETDAQVIKGMRSLYDKINLHFQKIANPQKFANRWDVMCEMEREGTIEHWIHELKNHRLSIQRRIEELKRRGKYNGK